MKIHNNPYTYNTEYMLILTEEELNLLRFDMSMALAFSQYDKYNIFDHFLTITEHPLDQ
jgi:hypothetical protein